MLVLSVRTLSLDYINFGLINQLCFIGKHADVTWNRPATDYLSVKI